MTLKLTNLDAYGNPRENPCPPEHPIIRTDLAHLLREKRKAEANKTLSVKAHDPKGFCVKHGLKHPKDEPCFCCVPFKSGGGVF